MRDDEPVFIRSRWGTKRYVYNWGNPVGRALIVGSLVFAVVSMYILSARSTWSEGELHDAVHEAARSLQEKPKEINLYDDYDSLIREAIEDTGEGPAHGKVAVDRVSGLPGPGSTGAGNTSGTDDFDITSDDVLDAYCMRIAPHEPDVTRSSVTLQLTVVVEEGRCSP